MDKQILRRLEIGDIVMHRHCIHSYVVTGNYGGRVTAVRTADVTNEREWDLVRKVKDSFHEDPDFNITAPDIEYVSGAPNVPKPEGPIKRCIREMSFSSAGICSKCQSTVERRFIFFGQKRCINPECGKFS